MHDLKTRERVDERIRQAAEPLPNFSGEEEKRLWAILWGKSRFAELLIRNPTFREDYGSAFKEAVKRLKARGELSKNATSIWGLYKEHIWQDFCYRWGISDHWIGKLEANDLFAAVFGHAAIIARNASPEIIYVPLGSYSVSKKNLGYQALARGQRWPKEVSREKKFIYLRISPMTTREEYEQAWLAIEHLKKEIWGFSDRYKRAFERDLCFWDLHNRAEFGELSYGEIVLAWRRNFPGQRFSRATVQAGNSRIKEAIGRLATLA